MGYFFEKSKFSYYFSKLQTIYIYKEKDMSDKEKAVTQDNPPKEIR